jgi:hypothetical protein
MTRRIMKFAVSATMAATFALGVVALYSPAEAVFKPCICPDVYAPVICSNGVTYSNSCVASCNHATGCHRTGDI